MSYVLIFLSMEGCHYCTQFEKQWRILVDSLKGCEFYVFKKNPGVGGVVYDIPKCLRKYAGWFPSIILVTRDEFYKHFSSNDNLPQSEQNDMIKGYKYDANFDGDRQEFVRVGHDYEASQIAGWYKKMTGT